MLHHFPPLSTGVDYPRHFFAELLYVDAAGPRDSCGFTAHTKIPREGITACGRCALFQQRRRGVKSRLIASCYWSNERNAWSRTHRETSALKRLAFGKDYRLTMWSV